MEIAALRTKWTFMTIHRNRAGYNDKFSRFFVYFSYKLTQVLTVYS